MDTQLKLQRIPLQRKVSLPKFFAAVLTLVAPLSYAATTSVDCATTDLHTAIASAAAGDTLSIKNTCYANGVTFIIDKNLTLEGADATAILDGTNGGLSAANPVSVVWTKAPAVVTFKGLTIQNGLGNGLTTVGLGKAGGLTSEGTTTIIQSSIINNKGSTFNGANEPGSGGILSTGSLTIQQSLIANNHSSANGFGGGLRVLPIGSGLSLFISQSTFFGNTSLDGGGGMEISGTLTSATISQSTFSGNSTGINSLFNGSTPLTVSQSIIANSTGSDTTGDVNNFITDNSLMGSVNGTPLIVAFTPEGLSDHGGATPTLKPADPAAIGQVPANATNCNASSPVADQRGAPRPGVGKTMCDFGAYETGAPKLSLIIPSGGALNFGPVTQGNSLTLLSQVQNTGNEALLLTDAFTVPVAPSTVSKFALATPPALPVNLAIQQVQDFNVRYTPTAGVTDTATLNVRSTDTGGAALAPVVVNLNGSGSGYVQPPIQQITDILNFMKANYPANLNGIGKGLLAKVSFDLFYVGVQVSGKLIGAGKTQLACVALKDLALLSDGKPKPPDIVTGSAVPQLYTKIKTLTTTLGCAP